jgi:hypothetical protein
MQKFWMVWKYGGSYPMKRHSDPHEAAAEAERLTKKENAPFVVLEAMAICEPGVPPVKWTPIRR